MKPRITLVAAHDEAGGIGAGDGLPWPRVPEDMKRFRDVTRGRPLVMGRRTMETLGRPLPWRQNIVMTRNREWSMDQVTTVRSPEAALAAAGTAQEVMIVGGAEIYRTFMGIADRLVLTLIHGVFESDVRWSPDLTGWTEKERQKVERDGEAICTFLEYLRDR